MSEELWIAPIASMKPRLWLISWTSPKSHRAHCRNVKFRLNWGGKSHHRVLYSDIASLVKSMISRVAYNSKGTISQSYDQFTTEYHQDASYLRPQFRNSRSAGHQQKRSLSSHLQRQYVQHPLAYQLFHQHTHQKDTILKRISPMVKGMTSVTASINSGILKIIKSVLSSCLVSPLTVNCRRTLCGSGIFSLGMKELIGKKE